MEVELNKVKHGRKLFTLGLSDKYDSFDPNIVNILNQSNYVFTSEEKQALTLGLKFIFNPTKLCYTRFYTGFENLNYQLSKVQIRNCVPNALNCFKAI